MPAAPHVVRAKDRLARARARLPRRGGEPLADRAFRGATGAFAAGLLLLAGIIFWKLWDGAQLALGRFGVGFLTSSEWDPVNDVFGAVPFIAGTLLTSALALLLAVPVSLGIAILLAEYAPAWLRDPLSFLVELLAAIPSVVYGLWGLFVLAPFMRDTLNPAIESSPLGALPIFGTPLLGLSMLTAALILAMMVVPIVAAISREVLLAVPGSQREAALALGLTRWEATRHAVLAYGRAGIFGAAILGLGRALGETMAVTMVIGNQVQLTFDYFQPAYTLSAQIANQFAEAVTPLEVSALIGLGLTLFVLSLVVNVGARMLVRKMKHAGGAGQ
jgi:phosphate transport system permease protein